MATKKIEQKGHWLNEGRIAQKIHERNCQMKNKTFSYLTGCNDEKKQSHEKVCHRSKIAICEL